MANRYSLVSHINLLPWREERRARLQREFVASLGLTALVAAAAWFGVREHHVQVQEHQNERIAYVQENIDKLEKKLIELAKLREEQERLLARIRAIEELQSNRALVVRLFDELVDGVPEGVTVSNLEQTGNLVKISGVAESHANVSALMRNIESSEWLEEPELSLIEKQGVVVDTGSVAGQAAVEVAGFSRFDLQFKQMLPLDEDEADGEGGG